MNPSIDSPRRRTVVLCLVAMVASVAVAWVASGFAITGIEVPFTYDGDGISVLQLIKATLEYGWYQHLPDVGAPFGTVLYDFPNADTAHIAAFKLFGLFGATPATALNLFHLSGFATATASACYVLRRWQVEPGFAVATALAFSWLPYHFLRPEHIFLVSYYTVPVYAHLAMLAYQGRLQELFSISGRPLATMAWCALLAVCASSGLYYAFFACVLIAFGGLAAAWEGRSLRHLGRALLVVLAIVLVLIGNVIGSIAYRAEAGPNPSVAVRQAYESEMYGLRVTQLLLPSPEHRVPALAALTGAYNRQAPLVTENATAGLGAAGAVGFLASLAALMLARRRSDPMLARLGAFNAAALLYGTMGGFGALFAFLASPQIRGLNRISVFIGFFSLAAFAHVLQLLLRSTASERARTAASTLLAIGIALLAWFDQVPRYRALAAPERATLFHSDADFVRRTTSLVPSGGCVYQLPYVPFPEEPPRFREGPYGMLRPYLHSTGIAWSAGAIRGREADRWLAGVERIPLADRMGTLAAAGFSAIFVQRDAYDDGGFAVEDELRALLGLPALVSDDRLRALYLLPAAPAGAPSLPGSRCVRRANAPGAPVAVHATTQPAAAPVPAAELNEPLAQESIAIGLTLAGAPEHLAAIDELVLRVRIENRGTAMLSPRGRHPAAMGLMLLAPDGSPDHAPGNRDFRRGRIPQIGPGASGIASVRFPAAEALGRKLRVQLVQEHVAWFDAYGLPSLDLGPFERCARDASRICGPDGKPL